MKRKLTMLVEVECDEMAFDPAEPESLQYFSDVVLMNPLEEEALYLHSNAIGDTVGRVRVLSVHNWPPKS